MYQLLGKFKIFLLLSLYDCTNFHLIISRYAQSYYTLQSIYPLQQIPPSVHLHIRRFPLESIPIGIIDPKLTSDPEALFDSATTEEKEIFDLWVRERWIEKDQLMEDFYKNGKFIGEEKDTKRLIVKCELNGLDDWVSCYYYFGSLQCLFFRLHFVRRLD